MDAATIRDSFDRHRASPEVSIDEYVRRRNIELGEWVMARERVYLDKCFWIIMCNARANHTDDPAAHSLLDGLARGVKQGRLVCPISDALFIELMKQTDPQSRLATADLIDELSCGVTLAPHPTRVATEIAYLFHVRAGYKVHALEVLVWSKLSHVLGTQHPVPTAFPPAEQVVIQKAFFDHMWSIPLRQMVETIGDARPPKSPYPDLAARLNRDNAAHAGQMKSFAQVYKDEVHGVLDLATPIACDVLSKIPEKAAGAVAIPTGKQGETSEAIYGLLCAEIAKPAVKQALRTLHIGALLHAAVRWNRTQKLVANDLYDFHHAEAAIGYCDMFLTDGPMHTLLVQRHLSIDRDFPCKVTSSCEAAASWVQ